MNIEKYTEELITLRHYFHQHPELALQEVETSAYIRKYLEKLGYEIVPIEPTGLIAELPSLKTGRNWLYSGRRWMHCPYRSRQIYHMHQ